jgi:phosphatidylinositol dimannoside acyltransferase
MSRRLGLAQRLTTLSLGSARAAGLVISPLGVAIEALPLSLQHALGDGLGLLMWLLGGSRRRDTAANFAALLETTPESPVARRLARRAFASFGRMSLDFFALTAVSDAQILERVDVGGYTLVDQALQRGRGVILALPHLGSWDLAARVGLALHYPITAVAEGGWGTAFVAAARAGTGLKVYARGQSLRPLLRALANNEPVCLISDMVPPGARGIVVQFAGQRACLPEGPARLAVHSGAPIVPCTAIPFPDGSGKAWASTALYPPEAGSLAERMQALTQALAREYEALIRQYPEQWYAFRPLACTEAAGTRK